MKIDCRNLGCPEPVIRSKNALQNLKDGELLEVLLNSFSSISNVTRFAQNQGFNVSENKLDSGDTILKIYKEGDNSKNSSDTLSPNKNIEDNNFSNKTIFVKDDRMGEGDFGRKLMKGFFKALSEYNKIPKNIIFVNRGILLTTQDDNLDLVESLKILESKGTKIYSCGLCFENFKIDTKSLKIGVIGNAFDNVNMMMNTDVVSI